MRSKILKSWSRPPQGLTGPARLSHLVKLRGSCGYSILTSFQNYQIEMNPLQFSLDNSMWIIPLLITLCWHKQCHSLCWPRRSNWERRKKFLVYELLPFSGKVWSIKYSEPDVFRFRQITAVVERKMWRIEEHWMFSVRGSTMKRYKEDVQIYRAGSMSQVFVIPSILTGYSLTQSK